MAREMNDKGMNQLGYSDADYAGCKIGRKSTRGSCQFLGNRLISWFSKKQMYIATLTAEAEYLAAGSCCAQMLWIQQQLKDYGIQTAESPIFCDNTSAIAITYNHLLESPTLLLFQRATKLKGIKIAEPEITSSFSGIPLLHPTGKKKKILLEEPPQNNSIHTAIVLINERDQPFSSSSMPTNSLPSEVPVETAMTCTAVNTLPVDEIIMPKDVPITEKFCHQDEPGFSPASHKIHEEDASA
ncbi:uncharacterized protein LOC142521931 [Primulina tabacum]|uniref:uncharacterized protein LOC142521931 n=1 Tax=Primulina tabacum TaxID=48773 RepID=UPI003F5994EC